MKRMLFFVDRSITFLDEGHGAREAAGPVL